MQKNKRIFVLVSALSLFLTSCEIWHGWGTRNRKIDYMFECFFKLKQGDKSYFLKVSEISKNEYDTSNGVNVVDDFVYRKKDPKYYLIQFYSSPDDNPYSDIVCSYNFINLEEASPDVKAEPICYKDCNDNLFSPKSASRESLHGYLITYDKEYFSFFEEIK